MHSIYHSSISLKLIKLRVVFLVFVCRSSEFWAQNHYYSPPPTEEEIATPMYQTLSSPAVYFLNFSPPPFCGMRFRMESGTIAATSSLIKVSAASTYDAVLSFVQHSSCLAEPSTKGQDAGQVFHKKDKSRNTGRSTQRTLGDRLDFA